VRAFVGALLLAALACQLMAQTNHSLLKGEPRTIFADCGSIIVAAGNIYRPLMPDAVAPLCSTRFRKDALEAVAIRHRERKEAFGA